MWADAWMTLGQTYAGQTCMGARARSFDGGGRRGPGKNEIGNALGETRVNVTCLVPRSVAQVHGKAKPGRWGRTCLGILSIFIQ